MSESKKELITTIVVGIIGFLMIMALVYAMVITSIKNEKKSAKKENNICMCLENECIYSHNTNL